MTPELPRPFEDLADEYVARLRSGESTDPEEYAAEHPTHAARIRELFPVLAMMEGLKPGPVAPPPLRVGPFEIRREIGHGGMGRVFEAVNPAGERVAVKVVHPHLVSRPGYLARFLREVEAGGRVDHPGLVRTIASGLHEEGGFEVPYLVLEFVEGQNLRDLIAETGSVSERLAREIAVQVADTLAAVHGAGIVHRDVKPENVVIAPDETVKLMDLGVAFLAEEGLRLTQTGEFVGSLLYAAPEQLRGDVLDGRADLYALGLLLYEVVAGRQPGEGRRPLREAAPDVSPFFDRLVRCLLAREPAQRLPDARALAETLRQGERSAWWRDQVVVSGDPRDAYGDTPFYGRDGELERLAALYDEVDAGEGRTLLLEGEPGIGKSRLLAEWLHRIHANTEDGPRCLIARHEPGAHALARPPLAVALAEALQGRDRRERLAAYLGPRAGLLDALLHHLDGDEVEGAEGALSPAARGTAYLDVLRGMAAERKLVVVLEDLHFGSEEARALFLLLARGLAEDPVLVVATSRPETEGLWPRDIRGRSSALHLAVGGIGEEAAHELLRASLGTAATLGSGLRDLVQQADGNPFCLLEFARELDERREGRASASVGIPSSLRELVEARLRALDREDRDLLAVAACAVDPFDPVLICDAVGLPPLRGLRRFHALHRERGLLRAEGPTYRFQHHLVREVLHEDLPPALKATYHAALGDALEARIPAAERESLAGVGAYALVRHFLLGERPRRALPYAREAVQHLHAERDWPRSVAIADSVLALADGLSPRDRARIEVNRGMSLLSYAPTEDATRALEEALARARQFAGEEIAVNAATGLAIGYRHGGQNERALGVHREALELARRLGRHPAHARALGFLALSLAEIGRLEEARVAAEEGLALAKDLGAPVTAAEIARHLGAIEIDQGHLPRARQLLEHTLSVGEFYGEITLIQNSLQLLGKLAFLEGNLPETLEMTRRLVRHNQVEGHARMEAIGRVNLAAIHGRLGQFDEEATEASACLAIAERMGYADVAAHARVSLGKLDEHRGDLRSAEAHLRGAYEAAVALQQPMLVARMGIPLARLLGWTGRVEEGRRLLAAARHAAEPIGAIRELAHVRNVEAELDEIGGDDASAAERWRESVEALETAGIAHEGGWCRLRLGQALARLGQADAAREALASARDVLTELGSRGYAAEAVVWLGVLPGGDTLVARQALEQHEARMDRLSWIRAAHALGTVAGDAGLLEAARQAAERWIAGAAEEHQVAMRALLPLSRLSGGRTDFHGSM